MARALRIEYEGAFYHVTARGNERKNIFFARSDYERFKRYLREAQGKYGYLLHSYVLMANHYHMLIETPHGNMSKVMHFVNTSYTGYINRKRRRSGHLFQGRYKAILVDHDSHLLELSRYLHLNPVRAHLVSKPEQYPYSSYGSYISGRQEDIISRSLILGMVTRYRKDATRRYREFVERAIDEELESPLRKTYGGVILGGPRFVKEALGRLKETVLQQEDISRRRELQTAWRTDDVIEAISLYFKISREKLFEDKGAHRNIAIYFLKKHTGMTNRQVGKLFGDISYTAVAKAYQRFLEKLSRDKSVQKTIKQISREMSHVKT